MSRSLKVAAEYITKAKNALKRNGFPSQKALALELGISRGTISKFLNGKAIDYLNFVEISEKLGLDWQEINDLKDDLPEANTEETPTTTEESSPSSQDSFSINNEGEPNPQGNRETSIGQGNYNEKIQGNYYDNRRYYYSESQLSDEKTDKLDNSSSNSSKSPQDSCKAKKLAEQMRGWFEALNYSFETYQVWSEDYFEWIITVPARRGYDRILVRGVDGEAGIKDFKALSELLKEHRTDEAWLVAWRRIAPIVKQQSEPKNIYCYTFDELLDDTAQFDGYIKWLEAEIERRKIDTQYVPLACTKEEFDPKTKEKLGTNRYGEDNGWIEGYIEKWLADDSKEHLSVLGEFGTGKTWFAFHYAWITLQKYLATKAKGIERPRLPLVIPLRDYAKAVTVESLFSEFFFRIHKIPLPSYSAFEQLNRMGKLLLIFDGFDEMAARIDKQAMINNFWELARVIVPGAKAILTCRTEHFPEDKEERKLLNAELKTATSILTGEAPQFEVLKLEKFNQQQIELVLEKQEVKPTTIKKVMANQELLDLACRPVMVDLIVEALPEIEQGKPVDLARIYLYAVTKKMNRDIETKRTFTSLADKLYFLCELSWEMISTDKMSLNYRNFSERIRRYFGKQVEAKDEDYWGYDMRRNTILVRNSEGDYSPAHRSFLEFFVAYKFAASLGILAEDFTDLARSQNTEINDTAPIQRYTWSQYFFQQVQRPRSNKPLLQLAEFLPETLEHLISFFSHNLWNKAILDLILPMNVQSVQFSPDNKLLATGDIRGSVHLWKVEDGQKLKTLMGHDDWIRCVSFSVDGNLLASASDDETVQLWDVTTGQSKKILKGHTHWVWCVQILGLEEKRMRLDA